MKVGEEITCEPIAQKAKGFTHQVRLGNKIVALTSDKNYGDVLVLTLTRMLWIKDLDQKVMLNLILDFVTMLATGPGTSVKKKIVKATIKRKPARV